jgi:UDP-GlcNAc:undecaprenyl-phosphate GlcNAc-1-phosphate transferase
MSSITFRVIFISVLAGLVIGLPLFWLTRRLNLLDQPGSAPHKLHKSPVPLAGGLVVYLSVMIIGLITGALSHPNVQAILLPATIVFIFGLWDDIRGLSAPWKLLGQLLATVCILLLGVQIRLFDQLPWLNLLITVLWIVGVTNAYNFVDSMDGLANGLGILAAAFFMLVTFDSSQHDLSLMSTILLGAGIGVFFYTASPAKFFLGDSGAQFLGFVMAGLGIAYNPVGFLRIQSWFVPILLVGVPIFDAALVIFSRLRRGKPIYRAGVDHTYHRLVSLGLHSNRAVLTMQFAALLLGCLAFIALTLPPLAANLIFFTCLMGGLIFILYLDSKKRWP